MAAPASPPPRARCPFPAASIVLADPPALWRGAPSWSWTAAIPSGYFNLWVLLEGTVSFTLRGRTLVRNQPSYFLLPAGERVRAINAGPGPLANFALHVAAPRLPAAWATRGLTDTWGAAVRQFEGFAEMARGCVDAGLRADPAHRAYAASLAQALLQRFWRDVTAPAENPTRERLFDLAGRIRQRPEMPWRVHELASGTGYSRSRFTRLFTETLGVPPREYVTRSRIERARALLQESDMTVSEIAFALGYADVFFFSRHFKQITGRSPRAYRRAI